MLVMLAASDDELESRGADILPFAEGFGDLYAKDRISVKEQDVGTAESRTSVCPVILLLCFEGVHAAEATSDRSILSHRNCAERGAREDRWQHSLIDFLLFF